MPKKKRATKPTSAQTKKGKPFWKQFFGFLFSPPVLRLIAALIIAGLIYWFWPDISDWAVTTWEGLLELLGIGLLIVAVFLGLLLWIILAGKFSLLVRYWNFWLGGICLAIAIWGIAAFFNPGSGIASRSTLGGETGQNIIGTTDIIGILRLAGLIVLAIIFMAPRWSGRIAVSTARGTGVLIKRGWQAATAPKPKEPRITIKPEARPEQPPPTITPTTAPPAPIKTPTSETWEQDKHRPMLTLGGWQLPPISILDKPTEVELSQSDIKERAQLIRDALGSYGVDVELGDINVGPTVTQFEVIPGWDYKYKEVKERDKDGSIKARREEVARTRVKVERISSLASDLALVLAVPSIRIEAPIPGKSAVGIEVPNITFGLVNLRSVIESTSFQKISAKSKLTIALGKGAGGETVAADLGRMPHLLVAGATGSGKTACLNSIICSLLVHNTPDDVQFIMIDPKRVELVNFNRLPHLIAPVVVEIDKAVMALRWLILEMDNRYRKFAQVGARNIDGYNKEKHPGDTLPYIVVLIDELADLMMTAFDEVQQNLCRLAQLARATGIHLIVATQRPSVDVVTGLIKANFPTRISFALTSQVDSRTILDAAGAEKLLGRGDMLYMPTDASKPKRLQGTFVSDAEIDRLVNFWGSQPKPEKAPVEFEEIAQPPVSEKGTDDSLLDAARQLAREHKEISASFLQRRLRIGYPRAARLFDQLQEEGYGKKATDQPPQDTPLH
ncbi:MAG: DNA translocase FtsK [Chloroflexi bacterium]|nr:DNA translocase FtsK [Chloroflexota bacterium]MBM3175125.1 DNA translocase FtsK [Chloroflexota bacterium]MBM4449780.1 DNA translocase FtsK [Chloroflexota bacterium]